MAVRVQHSHSGKKSQILGNVCVEGISIVGQQKGERGRQPTIGAFQSQGAIHTGRFQRDLYRVQPCIPLITQGTDPQGCPNETSRQNEQKYLGHIVEEDFIAKECVQDGVIQDQSR